MTMMENRGWFNPAIAKALGGVPLAPVESTATPTPAEVTMAGAPAELNASSGTGAIAQVHQLAGTGAVMGGTSSTGAIGAGHQLASAAATQARTSSTGAITQAHQLAGAASTLARTAGTGAIGQTHQLAGAAAVQARASSSGAIGQAHQLAGAASTRPLASSSGAAGVVAVPIVGAPGSMSSSSGAAGITQTHQLGGTAGVQSSSSSSGEFSIAVDPRFARPTADLTAGPWRTTGNTSLAEAIREPGGQQNNLMYTDSPGYAETRLGAVANPGKTTGQVVRYAAHSITGMGALTVQLKEGDRVIAEWHHPTLPPTQTVFARTLTTEQAASITDYQNLRFGWVGA